MRRPSIAVCLFMCIAPILVTTVRLRAQQVGASIPGSVSQADLQREGIRNALAALEALLARYRKDGNRQAEASTLTAMGTSYNALHQSQKAVENFQAAVAIWRQLGSKKYEAATMAHIGDVYRDWGFPEQANRYYRNALDSYPATDEAGRAATLNNLSLTYFSLNDRKRCFESLDQALAMFRELRDRRGEAMALANMGTAYVFLSNDPLKAISFLQQAITKLEILNDRDAEAGALDKMGVAWRLLNKPEMAGLSFQHALALFHQVGNSRGEAAVRKHMKGLGEPETQASTQ